MNMAMLVFFIFTICLSGTFGFQFTAVDLTHIHGNDSIYWPTHFGYERYIVMRGLYPGTNIWVASNTIKTTEHLGTHLDAPQHFNEYSWTVHQIPIGNLIGPGVIVDVKDKAASNADYRATQADLENWESKFGKIPDGAIVIMNSGWHKRYPDKKLVFNTEHPSNTSSFHFPSWHEDAISWLLSNRKIHVLGVDTPSLDYGQSGDFPVHVLIARENIPGLENVGYLDKIPESGTIISAAVMKIEDGSGSPARVFAMVPKDNDPSSGCVEVKRMNIIVMSLIVILLLIMLD